MHRLRLSVLKSQSTFLERDSRTNSTRAVIMTIPFSMLMNSQLFLDSFAGRSYSLRELAEVRSKKWTEGLEYLSKRDLVMFKTGLPAALLLLYGGCPIPEINALIQDSEA